MKRTRNPNQDASVQNQVNLVLTRSPLLFVLIVATACMFSLSCVAGMFGLVRVAPGQGWILSLIASMGLWALAAFEFVARRNQRLELDQSRIRIWDWRRRLTLDSPLDAIIELRWDRSGEGGALWLITQRGRTKLNGFGSLYDLGTALRKLGTVRVDESF